MSNTTTLSKLRECQSKFNEAFSRSLSAAIRRLQEERDDLLLQLIGPTGNWSQLNRLYLIYYDLMLKATREGNKTELSFYKSKVTEVKDALRALKAN